jgi:coenzyme F420-reducing hydrogenase beta subunit
MNSSIANIKNCYGCGVCVVSCPLKIIKLELDKSGFYQAAIFNMNKCTNCGMCFSVCAYAHNELSIEKHEIITSYAAWSNDERVRRKCSSGGIGFEIGKQLIEQGYKVCGVKYNAETEQTEHYIAATVEEFILSIGSKYIQSYTVDGFKAIDKTGKYLVTGTPCQIDSFRRLIRKRRIEDNFVLMDFFCHGVPSMLVWKKYVQEVEKITGKVIYASWRNKQTGWHDSWAVGIDGVESGEKVNWNDNYNILIKEKKSYYNSRFSQGDLFYKFFLSDSCLGKACYERCKYKYEQSAADIRIGDLWGEKYKKEDNGVSALISFTTKGDKIVRNLIDCTLIKESFKIVAEGQMKSQLKKPYYYLLLNRLLHTEMSLYRIYWIVRILRIKEIIIYKIKKNLKK